MQTTREQYGIAIKGSIIQFECEYFLFALTAPAAQIVQILMDSQFIYWSRHKLPIQRYPDKHPLSHKWCFNTSALFLCTVNITYVKIWTFWIVSSLEPVHHMLLLSSTANSSEEEKKETPEESEREEQTATRESEEKHTDQSPEKRHQE